MVLIHNGVCTRSSFSPFSLSVRYSSLRVHRERLGRSDILSAGIAGWSWIRTRATVRIFSRYSFRSFVAVFCLCAVWRHAGSQRLDLSGQIQLLWVWFFLVSVLHRAEPVMTTKTSTCSSTNKAVCNLFICAAAESPLLLPAGRGGEGEKEVSSGACGSGGSRGSAPVLVLVRCARRSTEGPPMLPLRWREMEFGHEVSPHIKRCHRRFGCLLPVFVFLAGHGSEGEKDGRLVWSAAVRWVRELLELALPAALPKRRCCLAVAIQGHRVDHAVLSRACCLSMFYLRRRIFPSLGAALKAPSLLSGLVPGETRSGGDWRLFVAGDVPELDCVLVIVCRVFCVKVRDLAVFSLFVRSYM